MKSGTDSLFRGLVLPDLWQQDAVRALKSGHDVIVDAPTGAGKTRVFELYRQDLVGQAVFTVPTRALANDKYQEWRAEGWDVGIATGDVSLNTTAPTIVATLETQLDSLFGGRGPRCLVIDEYQMVGDRQRGAHYELAVAMAPPDTQLLFLSGSVGNPQDISAWLTRLGREVSLVRTSERPVPLDDLPLEALPREAPRRIRSFWQRMAVEALLADCGPLLVFAPHRDKTESIARKIAEALPTDDPLELSNKQREITGKHLQKLLRKRVAFHHSGLPYPLRAGLIEPLAREGQLRVIVATMGLAAGINFSVRSVYVAGTEYRDGPYLRQLHPDELLQMFGRAGRRGKDETGYVLRGLRSPGLMDARPLHLRRAAELEWPLLIRFMGAAADQGRNPFVAAHDLCGKLFEVQSITLGTETRSTQSPPPAENVSDGNYHLGPVRHQVLGRDGKWHRYDETRDNIDGQMEQLNVSVNDKWVPALRQFQFVARLIPLGRVTKLGRGKYPWLGKEIVLLSLRNGIWRAPRSVSRKLPDSTPRRGKHGMELANTIVAALCPSFKGAEPMDIVESDGQIRVRLDFRRAKTTGYQDKSGFLLLDPPRRSCEVRRNTNIHTDEINIEPVQGSPVHAWRELELIDKHGRPTRRGRIFGFFRSGEGLAVSAALEDPTYEVRDIVGHLANIRAGHRFDSLSETGSDRLSVACRAVFGMANYEGVLRLGLPPQYGDGATECLEMYLRNERQHIVSDLLAPGDIERALREWVSLLRQIVHAPVLDWDRWTALKRAAGRRLEDIQPRLNRHALVENMLTATQRSHRPRHRLRWHDLGHEK